MAAGASPPMSLPALLRSDRDALTGPPNGSLAGLASWRRFATDPRLRACLLLRLTIMVPPSIAFLPRNALITLHQMDCALPVTIGPGLRLPRPSGVVFGRVAVGRGVTVYDGATVASKSRSPDGPPLRVGDHSTFGSRSTVVMDGEVPTGTLVEPGRFVDRFSGTSDVTT